MAGISEQQFFYALFGSLRETEQHILMKGVDFPTGPQRDFLKRILLNHLAGKDGITPASILVGVVTSEKDREKVAELEQVIATSGRLWVGYVLEGINAGYMVSDWECGYIWDSARATPYEPEKGTVCLRHFLDLDGVLRLREEFYQLAERTPQSKDIIVRHLFE